MSEDAWKLVKSIGGLVWGFVPVGLALYAIVEKDLILLVVAS